MIAKSEFLKIITERGFFNQCTDFENLDNNLIKKKNFGYIGFDCTAPSLHVGSLIQIMMLRWFQKTGNVPIILLGGGTTKIGDPSGKDFSRPILSNEIILSNKKKLKSIFSNYINFDTSENKGFITDNEEWLNEINYISFLREFGSFFSINKMLTLESLKTRLERKQNLSFLEFNYPIFQAYDFLELNNRYECNIQMGGSDQWGNIINGVDLIRRKKSVNAFGLTSPLLATSSGAKMGKSENGAIWLDREMLSDYDFWQFWRNTEDNDVIRFLKLFTEIDLNEIKKLEKLKGSEVNEAKIILANEVTKICRGTASATEASKTANDVFNKKQLNENLPMFEVGDKEISIIDALKLSGFCNTNGEARRLIIGKGAKIDDKLISDFNLVICYDKFKGKKIKISAGKKNHALIYFKE